jgi:putative nucleotidyltransferase with HDIG domain
MRVPLQARVLVVATVGLGLAVVVVAAIERAPSPLSRLALLAAAVVLTELIQVAGDEASFDPREAHNFSFSSGVHIAAILMIGPWTGALVAAFGVIVVDGMRGAPPRRLAYNASVLALAAATGGGAYVLAGGSPGSISLPGDFLALLALALTYYAVNAVLVSLVIALASERAVWALIRDGFVQSASSAAGEVGFGLAFAYFALEQPWAVVALAPLVLGIYRSHERVVALRRETAHALETFANVVDERDSYTYRHSARVADYVQALARGLRLPEADVVRLRWAGRLHDLGKVSVDAAVLRKPGKLDEDEWAAMRRHPRLSARLLRRFRFAADEASAVEYHHERYDGGGYYAIDSQEIPLAAHFLVVADSFDAMTSDRPYRRGLPRDVALAEIESKAGTQFHPVVAKAFVALQRGLDPLAALSEDERLELRHLWRRRPVSHALALRWEVISAGSVAAGLGLLASGEPLLSIPIWIIAAVCIAFPRVEDLRARRLAARLRSALADETTGESAFGQVVAETSLACRLRWAGLVGWRQSEGKGQIEVEWSAGAQAPFAATLESWLMREADAVPGGVLIASGAELGKEDAHVALPLLEGDQIAAYLVLAIAGRVPDRIAKALVYAGGELNARLLTAKLADSPRHLRAVAL